MNLEEYLNEVARIIRENFQSNDTTGAMTAAEAGLIVKAIVGQPPGEFGFFRFKDVLQQLEQRGLLELTRTSKNALGLRLSGVPPTASPPVLPFARTTGPEPFLRLRRLRNQVWLALVSEAPEGRRFLSKKTGVVKMGQVAPPGPAEEWVEITSLDQSAEKMEATQFLETEGLADQPEFQQTIASTEWFRELPAALARRSPLLASKWNRRRTARAVALAEALQRAHDIDPALVFEQVRPRMATPPPSAERRNLRALLFSALGQMTTPELLELQIPARYLVSVLRPDLLND
jgi:hypothetical protein